MDYSNLYSGANYARGAGGFGGNYCKVIFHLRNAETRGKSHVARGKLQGAVHNWSRQYSSYILLGQLEIEDNIDARSRPREYSSYILLGQLEIEDNIDARLRNFLYFRHKTKVENHLTQNCPRNRPGPQQ